MTSKEKTREVIYVKKLNIVFIVFCLFILLIPFAGMAVAPANETTENKVLSEFPKLSEKGKPNVDFLNDLGEYFIEHFYINIHVEIWSEVPFLCWVFVLFRYQCNYNLIE